MQPVFLGIDPGLTKCGYAVLAQDGRRLALEVVPVAGLNERLERDMNARDVRMVCVGHATMSAKTVRQIRSRWPEVPIAIIDESNTTLQARKLYYQDHPPRGLMRLIPRGLLVPKEPLDGYAALLIVQRYVSGLAQAAEQ